jgi:chromosome segregation ATPase
MDLDHDNLIRELSKAKREIRVLTDEKALFTEKLSQNEAHIYQLSARVDGCVPKDTYEKLLSKYREKKQLARFHEDKSRSATFDLQNQKQTLQNVFAEKEELLNDQIRSLTLALRNQKDITAKLTADIQTLRRKLAAVANPASEKVTREELVIAEEKAREAEARVQQLTQEHQAEIEEAEKLRLELRRHRKAHEELSKEIADIKAKARSAVDITTAAERVREKLVGQKSTVKSVAQELNELLGILGVEKIEFLDTSRFWSLRSQRLFESPPEVLEKLARVQDLLKNLRQELGRFPITGPASSGEIEDERRALTEMVRDACETQAVQVQQLRGIISTQHSAIVGSPG